RPRQRHWGTRLCHWRARVARVLHVVGGPDGQRQRRGQRGSATRGLRDGCDRTLDRRSVLIEPNDGRRVPDGDFNEWADDVIVVQAKRNTGGLAVRHDGPRVFVLRRELFRHGHDEHPELPAGKEMRRLPQVGPTRLDPVVRSDGNVQLLLGIAIEIADQKTAAAILVREPAFEGANDACPELLTRLGDLLGGQQHAAGDRACGAQTHESLHCYCPSGGGFAVFGLRSATSALYSGSVRYSTFIQACAISSTVRSP